MWTMFASTRFDKTIAGWCRAPKKGKLSESARVILSLAGTVISAAVVAVVAVVVGVSSDSVMIIPLLRLLQYRLCVRAAWREINFEQTPQTRFLSGNFLCFSSAATKGGRARAEDDPFKESRTLQSVSPLVLRTGQVRNINQLGMRQVE